jgi:hypothetical protein
MAQRRIERRQQCQAPTVAAAPRSGMPLTPRPANPESLLRIINGLETF